MGKDNIKRIKKIGLLAMLGIFIGTGVAWHNVSAEMDTAYMATIEPAAGESAAAQRVAGMRLEGDFTLINHDGDTVSAADFSDQYKLVFFGFTHCPDICPAGLQKMSTALNTLGPEAEMVQPLFITVDPERDTPEILKDYVGLFHDRMIGLTGSGEQIAHATSQYKVYAARAASPEPAAAHDHDHDHHNHHDHAHHDHEPAPYQMDHSAFIYLMSPENELVGIFRDQDSPDMIAAEISRMLERS